MGILQGLMGENGVLSLRFNYEGEDVKENYNGNDQIKDDEK